MTTSPVAEASAEPVDHKPTWAEIRAVMKRPASLGLLALAIAFAVGFSLLGQWQLGRAFEQGAVVESESEDPLPISSEVRPQEQTPSHAVGQLVRVEGEFDAQDLLLLEGRLNDGRSGYWVTGRLQTDEGASLAVGLGWAPDEASARDALERYRSAPESLPTAFVGRYQQSEQPTVDEDAPAGALGSEMSVPAFVNVWSEPGPVYAGYLTLLDAPPGLEDIYSPAPEREVQLNFLNLFYTVEWILFAAIALYIWYRHMRDVAERELEQSARATDDGAEGPTARS